MSDKYTELLNFWNGAFALDEQTKQEYISQINPEEDWKEMAYSAKFRDIIINSLASQEKVLDYGCGQGWAGICIKKSGSADVTCVDVVENAAEMTKFFGEIFNLGEGFRSECVSTDWISESPAGIYDGLVCSNVIDVLPTEVADSVIANIARITTDDAKIVIGMNYHSDEKSDPEKGIEVKNGNEVYVNGVLRMVSRSDEEWTSIFEKYFKVDAVDHYSWPGETTERRRVFLLSK